MSSALVLRSVLGSLRGRLWRPRPYSQARLQSLDRPGRAAV